MIKGVGADIVDIRRIEEQLNQFGEKFEQKIFSEEEIAVASGIKDTEKRTAFYAKRFAAKEAYSKALGTGIGESVSFKDISVINEDNGKPVVKISGKDATNVFVSLSDEYPYAQAFVVIE